MIQSKALRREYAKYLNSLDSRPKEYFEERTDPPTPEEFEELWNAGIEPRHMIGILVLRERREEPLMDKLGWIWSF